ncbi:MAG: hypothetical protein HN948_00395 [Clostridia bacterium]|nr:hypothetical protein [Clostridia bacterium]MBT7121447.1 hypothetical protein [Clostridia bacterium]
MALLKFICNECKTVYEELTSADTRPPCPECGSPNIQRYYQGKCYFGGGVAGGSECNKSSCSSCSGCAS